MQLIRQIKRTYRFPIREQDTKYTHSLGDYCVLGGICGYLYTQGRTAEWVHFPNEAFGATLLQILNPRLTPGIAQEYAALIISANDDARFTQAWHYAACALAYTPEED